MEKYCPAPWTLTGKGYILLYRFPRTFVEEKTHVPEFLKGRFAGGFGALMLVDYASSNAGPYGELLMIPGKFNHNGRKIYSISKIYVSTMASVENGRRNWGIPKEFADFSFRSIDARTEQVTVSAGEHKIAEFTLSSGAFSFPISTKLVPFPLVQCHEGNYYYTNFQGQGTGRFAKLQDLHIHPQFFPDLSSFKPIMAIKVDPFHITFPEAVIVPAKNSSND